ncbi:hypothetical protein Tco_1368587 [Tanacetum coccineum]
MGTKVTSSSGSVLEEPEIQKLQMQAKIFKENSLNEKNALKSTTQLLDIQSEWYQEAFARLFGDSFRTFEFSKLKIGSTLHLHGKDSESSPEVSSSTVRAIGTGSGGATNKSRIVLLIALQTKQLELEKYTTLALKTLRSIQTIHMLAPKCATYHGRSTFANPKYLKKAQSDKPRLYEIPYDTSDPANRFCPDGEETVTLENESRSKLDKDTAPFLNDKMTSAHISSGLVLNQMTSDHNRSELGIQDHSNEQSSSKLVPKVVP